MDREDILTLIREDNEIKNAILDIFNQRNSAITSKQDEEMEMLKAFIEKWKKCFSDEQIQRDTLNLQLEEQHQALKQENLELQKKIEQLQNTNTQDVDILKFYKDEFEDEVKAYELFNSLSEGTKSSLSGIFKDMTLQGFLSCGIQDKNISSFWEYIKTELIEDKNKDTQNLVKIYDFLFQRYTKAFPMYEEQKIAKEEQFDPLLHINHSSSSSPNGTIQEVLLKGYVNNKTSKIIKQSVVKIG